MKKKYLAYFIPDLISLNAKIISQKFLIEQLCKNFDRLFIINNQNLKFFKTKESYNKKDFLLNKKSSKLIIKNRFQNALNRFRISIDYWYVRSASITIEIEMVPIETNRWDT